MIFYVVSSTAKNYTLVPQTNAAITKACQKLLGDIRPVFLGEDKACDQAFLHQLAKHNQRGEEYLVFDTTGKNHFEITKKKFIRNRFSYISDAPYTIWSNISQMEKRSIITYSDKGDEAFFQDIGYKKPRFFMPHGGPDPLADTMDYSDRDIDVLVIGRIGKEKKLADIAAQSGKVPFDLLGLLKKAVDKAISENIQPYSALKACAYDKNISLFEVFEQDVLMKLLAAFYIHVEVVNRNNLLRNFKKHKLDVIGPVRGDVPGITDAKHNFHGAKFGVDCLGFMKRAKVVLNSVCVFPGGSHERIWFGMAHGAAIFTDRSYYVEETFKDEESILFIDNTQQTKSVEKLLDALEMDGKLENIASKASKIYPLHHTWTQQLARVLPKVGEVIAKNAFVTT